MTLQETIAAILKAAEAGYVELGFENGFILWDVRPAGA